MRHGACCRRRCGKLSTYRSKVSRETAPRVGNRCWHVASDQRHTPQYNAVRYLSALTVVLTLARTCAMNLTQVITTNPCLRLPDKSTMLQSNCLQLHVTFDRGSCTPLDHIRIVGTLVWPLSPLNPSWTLWCCIRHWCTAWSTTTVQPLNQPMECVHMVYTYSLS